MPKTSDYKLPVNKPERNYPETDSMTYSSLSDRLNDAENKTAPNMDADQYTSMVQGLVKKGLNR